MSSESKVIDKLLERQHPREIVESVINDKKTYDGNRKQFIEDHGLDYIAFSRSLNVMDKIFEGLDLYVFSEEQVKKIRLYIHTLEALIK